MLYIAYLKTKFNTIAREADTFNEAWGVLNRLAQGRTDVVEALVLKETDYLSDQCPDFSSCKVTASMRIIQ